jgi:hypothetical protein
VIDVRPDRGLDIGRAWFGGRQIAWLSAVGEVPWNGDWRASWGGGLVTTCGLDNVGAPSEGIGLHGTYSSFPARDVSMFVRGTIDDPRGLRVERTISTEDGRLVLVDRTTNVGGTKIEAPLLYHVNVWGDGAEIESDAREVVPRDEDAAALDWRRGTVGDAPEGVWEHVGATWARVRSDGLEIEVRSSLPRLWQWIDPRLGALGIEPANCSVLGRAHDRSEGRLPVLAPGEERTTTLTITAKETR